MIKQQTTIWEKKKERNTQSVTFHNPKLNILKLFGNKVIISFFFYRKSLVIALTLKGFYIYNSR